MALTEDVDVELITTGKNILFCAIHKHLPGVYAAILAAKNSKNGCYIHIAHQLSISVDSPGLVSYARKPEFRYNCKQRTKTTLGRYLQRQIGIRITSEIEEGINRIMADCVFETKGFEVRSDVFNVYKDSTGPHTCMSHCPEVKWYEDHGVKVVTYQRTNRSKMARALLWEHTDQKKQYLDRIYPNSGPYVPLFQRWAKERGIVCRPTQEPPDDTPNYQMPALSVSNISLGRIPYMDTFCYLRKKRIYSTPNISDEVKLWWSGGAGKFAECPRCGRVRWFIERADGCLYCPVCETLLEGQSNV